MNFQSILVPVDFSDCTAEVVGHAAAMARAFSSRLILLHISEPDPDFVGYDPGPASVRTTVARDFRAEHQQLDALKGSPVVAGLDVLALHVQGALAEKIVQEAKTHGAGLIVLGSHGHGAFYNLFVGTVSATLIQEAPCPLLLIPAQAASKPLIGSDFEG